VGRVLACRIPASISRIRGARISARMTLWPARIVGHFLRANPFRNWHPRAGNGAAASGRESDILGQQRLYRGPARRQGRQHATLTARTAAAPGGRSPGRAAALPPASICVRNAAGRWCRRGTCWTLSTAQPQAHQFLAGAYRSGGEEAQGRPPRWCDRPYFSTYERFYCGMAERAGYTGRCGRGACFDVARPRLRPPTEPCPFPRCDDQPRVRRARRFQSRRREFRN
jgi:hypothetical protein